MFDHSCGHDKKRPDGLNVNGMTKGYGGKQAKMKKSLMVQEEGYLGEFYREVNLLKVNEYQSMVFSSEDDGPIGLSKIDRESTKYDRDTGKTKTVKYKMAELVQILKDQSKKIYCFTIEKYSNEILEIIDQEFKLSKVKIILTKCNPPITGFDGKVSIVRILENN